VIIGLIGGIVVLILVFTITNVRSKQLKNMTGGTRKQIGNWERIEDKVYLVIFILAILFIIFRVVFY
jgi:hypothetical protein